MAENPQKLTEAISEAQNIVQAAEARAEEIVSRSEEAYQEAYRRGYKEGLAKGTEEAAATAIRLVEETGYLSDRLSGEAAKLALAIAESVVGKHFEKSPEALKELASTAFRESVVGSFATIIAHPEDLKILVSHKEDFERLAPGARIDFLEDPRHSRGGCIVRTDFGEVDASLQGLLDGVASRLGIQRD